VGHGGAGGLRPEGGGAEATREHRALHIAPPSRARGAQASETDHTGHGREARRRTTVPHAITERRGDADGVGVRTRALGEAWWPPGDAGSSERRDDFSRLGWDAQPSAERVWGHWAREHTRRGGLDIACRADNRRRPWGPRRYPWRGSGLWR